MTDINICTYCGDSASVRLFAGAPTCEECRETTLLWLFDQPDVSDDEMLAFIDIASVCEPATAEERAGGERSCEANC
jgi:hypothetical protein